jgi:hypothetical protein
MAKNTFQFSTMKVENGTLVPVETVEVDQSQLTSECWLIQIQGLKACQKCEFLNKNGCGGKKIRKHLLGKK